MVTFRQSETHLERRRNEGGFLPLELCALIGDGQSVALCGADGIVDWWCVPNINSPPLFDRMLNGVEGGYFSIRPKSPFSVARRYVDRSNVLETVFTTGNGTAKLVESLNTGSAGRLPWAELARRIEGMSGTVEFEIKVRFSLRFNTIGPYRSRNSKHDVFHSGHVLGVCLNSDQITIINADDSGLEATVAISPGQQELFAIVAGEDEPLVVPSIPDIQARLDSSALAWREWTKSVQVDGPRRGLVLRNALALKLLDFSPSGAAAAVATVRLPTKVKEDRNYDAGVSRIRDTCYATLVFLQLRAQPEAKVAFAWLLQQVHDTHWQADYAVKVGPVPSSKMPQDAGNETNRRGPVGNAATGQVQLGVLGDILETAACFISGGNLLDTRSKHILSHLANRCADEWRNKDAGVWQSREPQHFTMSKISAWRGLARAVELARQGQLPTTCLERWERERDRAEAWICEHCWSHSRGSYVMFPGSSQLDASIALAARFGFGDTNRLLSTLDAIERELGAKSFHYRYSGAQHEEGCYLACTFWLVEARALLGQHNAAVDIFDAAFEGLQDNIGTYAEMIDPDTRAFLGNLPQRLTHVAIIQAIFALENGR